MTNPGDHPRNSPAPTAQALWSALRRAGAHGITAGDAATMKLCSEPYGRRLLRSWASAGYATREKIETNGLPESDVYRLVDGAPEQPPILAMNGTVEPRDGYMSAAEFAATRRQLGLSLAAFGRAIGRKGAPTSVNREMARFERGDRPIGKETAEKIRALKTSADAEKSKPAAG